MFARNPENRALNKGVNLVRIFHTWLIDGQIQGGYYVTDEVLNQQYTERMKKAKQKSKSRTCLILPSHSTSIGAPWHGPIIDTKRHATFTGIHLLREQI